MKKYLTVAFAMLAAAAVWSGSSVKAEQAAAGAGGGDVQQGHCADLLRELHQLPSAR